MKKTVFVLTVVWALTGQAGLFAQTPTAQEILAFVDGNGVYESIQYDGEMIIEIGSRKTVKTMKVWARGTTDSFIEFTNSSDRGAKYLKTKGSLRAWTPDVERVVVITGKDRFMGSDLSFEDTMENGALTERYDAALTGTETYNGRQCWVLELKVKPSRTESYPKRRLWIDTATHDLLHYELYALSGAVSKEYSILRVEEIGGRRFPVELEVRDRTRQNSKTSFIMRNIRIDEPIPDSVFSEQNLR
jgi:outer membrane lipoprotein-sorting protein